MRGQGGDSSETLVSFILGGWTSGVCWATAGSFWSFSFKVGLYLRDRGKRGTVFVSQTYLSQTFSTNPSTLVQLVPCRTHFTDEQTEAP